jgi:hypothetical protein
MRIFLQRRPEGGTGVVSAIAAWFLQTMGILDGLRSDLDPLQYRLAFDVIEQWSRVVPLTLGRTDSPRIVTEGEAPDLLELFDGTLTLAGLIHIFRNVLPHYAENRERDEAIYREVQAFCGEKADTIRDFTGHGSFEVEGWLFDKLAWHCQQLLLVVLGDVHQRAFKERYDAAMRDISEQIVLNQTPPS